MHNGIPAAAAFDMDNAHLRRWLAASDARRAWMAIKFSEFNGAQFDIGSMTFKERQ